MGIKSRLAQFLEYKGLNNREFEQLAGLSNGAVARIRDSSRVSTFVRIANTYPDLNMDWLRTGEGKMLNDGVEGIVQPSVSDSPDVGRPYYDVDFTCSFGDFDAGGTNHPTYNINYRPLNKEGVTWVNATGHSMHPEVSSGDVIAIQEYQDWRTYLPLGEIYGIVTTHGMRTIKRVFKGSAPNTYRLVPSNKDYDEEEIDKSIILTVYRVLGAFKAF